MNVLLCVLLFVLLETKKSLSVNNFDDEVPSLLQKKVDVFPENFREPVPFGHITLAGVGDLIPGVKPPVNPVELSMVVPTNSEEAINLLNKGRKHVMFMKKKIPKGFASPRDKYLNDIVQPPRETNGTSLKWYNLAEIQRRNALMSSQPRIHSPRNRGPPSRATAPSQPKNNHFARKTFELKREEEKVLRNWTTCEQFGVGAVFDPKEIVDISWTPFYIWSLEHHSYAMVHKFTYPSKKLVTEYRTKYNHLLNKTIDWSQPKLFSTGLSEMLLIALDKRGLFDAILKHELPELKNYRGIKLPSLTVRLRIEDPYLVMMYCEDYYATAMAISGTEPTLYKDIKQEVATINFIGKGQPVWRDYEGEQENTRLEIDAKLKAESNKIIKFEQGPLPAINQYD